MSEVALKDQELTVTTLGHLIDTPAIPDRWESVPDALAAIFVGRELGLGPMMSLTQLYIVDGQVALDLRSAALPKARLLRPRLDLERAAGNDPGHRPR